jgi:hypothetical protein
MTRGFQIWRIKGGEVIERDLTGCYREFGGFLAQQKSIGCKKITYIYIFVQIWDNFCDWKDVHIEEYLVNVFIYTPYDTTSKPLWTWQREKLLNSKKCILLSWDGGSMLLRNVRNYLLFYMMSLIAHALCRGYEAFLCRERRQQVTLKRRIISTRLHGVISRKTILSRQTYYLIWYNLKTRFEIFVPWRCT